MPVDISVSSELDVDYPGAVARAQHARLEDAMDRGFAVSQERVPQDRGTLMQTAVPPEWDDGKIEFRYTQPYARPMEFGTTGFHPPTRPLVEWAERVAGDPGLGYYVANVKIPEEGIEAQPYARPGREAAKRWLEGNGFGRYLERELDDA